MASDKQRKTFLSYSRLNKEFAVRLAKELKSEGFDVWLDQLDIPAGARWDREVEKALRESEIFMIILTPSSVDSENVLDEIGYAIDNGKRFLPVLLEKCDVPLRLRRFQYVDFTNKDFDDGVESAKELLRSLIAQPTIPRGVVVADLQAEAERKAKEEEESDRLAAKKAEEERDVKVEAETKAKEEADRLAAQMADEERVAIAKIEADRKAKEESDYLAAKRAEEDRLARQKAEEKRKIKEDADRAAKLEADRKAKEESERLAAQKTEAERVAKAKAEEERVAKAKAEADRKAKEEADRLAAKKAEEERQARQRAEEEQVAKAEEKRKIKEDADRAAKLEADRKAREAARQLPDDQKEQDTKVERAPIPTTPRKPISKGVMFGATALVLVCGAVGYGALSFVRGLSPTSSENNTSNTQLSTPTNPPVSIANPTNTSVSIPEASAVPSRTPESNSPPTAIEVEDFTTQGTWTRLENCPGNKSPCWADNPSGEYVNDMYYTITSPGILVDQDWENPYLIYWQRYNTEGEYDYLQISINVSAIRANSGTRDWHLIAVDLESFKGRNIVIRFLIATDYSIVGEGWFLHDIKIVPNASSADLQSAVIVEP